MLKKIRRRKEKAVTNIPIPTVSFVMKYFSKSVPQTRVPEGGEAVQMSGLRLGHTPTSMDSLRLGSENAH